MTSELGMHQTRQEWRDLGFYYDRDDHGRRWLIVASTEGIAKFCAELTRFDEMCGPDEIGEHQHYGPYAYLEFQRAAIARIDAHAIAGRRGDLIRLAQTIGSRTANAAPGSIVTIGEEYGGRGSYHLAVRIAPPGFDPALEDPLLKGSPPA